MSAQLTNMIEGHSGKRSVRVAAENRVDSAVAEMLGPGLLN